MRGRYHPAFNALVFGLAEKRADQYWRLRKLDIADRRIAVYQEIMHLRSLPRLFPDQEQRLALLEAEYKRLMRCGNIENVRK